MTKQDFINLAAKVAVVTGAGSGIGRAVAERLALAGAHVICADIDSGGVNETAARISRKGGRVEVRNCDVRDAEAVDALLAATRAAGGPHIVVPNAAILLDGTIEETALDAWDNLFQVNVRGVYLTVRAAIPAMRDVGGGSIVIMASVNAFWMEPGVAAYASGKAATVALTRAIAYEFGRERIRCNCVCPGYIDTGFAQRYFDSRVDPAAARLEAEALHALGRMGKPEEVAALVHFLSSDDASFCTGQAFIIDGGMTLGTSPRPPSS